MINRVWVLIGFPFSQVIRRLVPADTGGTRHRRASLAGVAAPTWNRPPLSHRRQAIA